ncbi:MAG: DMT family transporter [Terracidiphilus sp.]|jgi:drug/metabolite transporter (DMT)-like permease
MLENAKIDRGPQRPGYVAEGASRRLSFLGYGACALAGCLWGTGFYFGRLALNEMSVEYMVLYRFVFASLGMLPVALVHRRRFRLTAAEFRTLLICATLGVPVQFLIQFHGLARTTVSHASLMVGSMPVMLAAAAALFAGERLDLFGWLALVGSTVGAALIVLGGSRGPATQGEPTLAGDLLVVFSLVTALAWILLSKKLMETHSPPVVTAYTIFSGTLMLAAWVLGPWLLAPLTHASVAPPPFAHFTLTAWIALAISGLLCTATTTLLWNWGIHHVPASRAGVFLNIEPALGSVLGVKLLGEHLGPYAWVGGGLILAAAVALTTRNQTSNFVTEPPIILE